MPSGSYSWLSLSTAINQLGQRLNVVPSASSFWTTAELQIYLTTALQMYNCFTWQWRTDFAFNPTSLWNSLGSITGSPRLRTTTDTTVYTELEYLLMEPPSGSTWTGTNQFSISVLAQALQRRRDEILQVTNANQGLLPAIGLTPGTTRTLLPQQVLDVERVRYLPVIVNTTGTASSGAMSIAVASTVGVAVGQIVSAVNVNYWTTVTGIGIGSVTISLPTAGVVSGAIQFLQPSTLYRDDTVAQEFYEAPLYQQPAGTPNTFSLSSEPPLSFNVDIPPNNAGTYEAIVTQTGSPFNPPTPTLIGIPNDFAWVLEWGALADLLGQEAESTDRERADYCLKRYQDGLQLMLRSPWIELGKINGQAVNCDSIVDTDRYMPEWDSNPTGFGPVIVTGGIDLIAAPLGGSVSVTVLGNAPILDSTNTYLQISQADADIMFDLAQARAMFKVAGEEWKQALELEQRAIQGCMAQNSRLKSLGAFSDILIQRGTAQERSMNRYNSADEQRQKRRAERLSQFVGTVGDRD